MGELAFSTQRNIQIRSYPLINAIPKPYYYTNTLKLILMQWRIRKQSSSRFAKALYVKNNWV
jgi:hypothetical protein